MSLYLLMEYTNYSTAIYVWNTVYPFNPSAWPSYVEDLSNAGPMRIQLKYLVPIYVFPEMKLRGLIISKT
jgi:hypothetical protein